MSDLIARLEAAKAGSRELDAEIAATFHIPPDNSPEWLGGWPGPFRVRGDGRVEAVHSDGKGGVHWLAPSFTTSLDAALTLVPDDARSMFMVTFSSPAKAGAYDGDKSYLYFEGATPALALCIAALRARAPAAGERE